MKIIEVESFPIRAKPAGKAYWGSRAWGKEGSCQPTELSTQYPSPLRRRFIYSTTIDTVIVKISTDEGLVGYGECKAPVAPQVTSAIVQGLLKEILIGSDPRDTTVLWERMYAGMRVRGHKAGFYLEAISGIDIALWDLVGKASGLPIYRLIGGCFRNPVRVYASGVTALLVDAPDREFELLADEASEIASRGFTALKIAIGKGVNGDLKSIRTLRQRLGENFLIYADAAGVYDRATALLLGKAMEDLKVEWFEMPIFPEDIEGYVELSKALAIPIALDSLASRYEAMELVRRGGLDVVQPDVCRAGGITECRRIAELADAFGLAYAPHVSIGSAIHFAATAQLATAMPNTMTSEYWIGDNPIGNAILKQPLRLEQGYFYTPQEPGLGIQLDESALFAASTTQFE